MTPTKGLLTSACHFISLVFLLAASLMVNLSMLSQVPTPPHCVPSGGLAFGPDAGWRGGIFQLGRVVLSQEGVFVLHSNKTYQIIAASPSHPSLLLFTETQHFHNNTFCLERALSCHQSRKSP